MKDGGLLEDRGTSGFTGGGERGRPSDNDPDGHRRAVEEAVSEGASCLVPKPAESLGDNGVTGGAVFPGNV